jgi:hypothetical protein
VSKLIAGPDARVDADGTPFEDVQGHDVGDFSTVYQEFRVEGAGPSLKWLVGANYERDHVNEDESAKIPDSFLGAFGSTANSSLSYLENISKSGYGSLDFSLTDKFALSGGVRYTDQHHTYTGCTVADDAITSAFFSFLDGAPQLWHEGAQRSELSAGLHAGIPTISPSGLRDRSGQYR